MQPGRFTELFFLDEATAFAAGHRPCALCRREDYRRFVSIWRSMHPDQTDADAIDAQLHGERVDPSTRRHRLHEAAMVELPDGVFVLRGGTPHLVRGDGLRAWTPSGYREPNARPRGGGAVIVTPPSLVALLRFAWDPVVPMFHPSAGVR